MQTVGFIGLGNMGRFHADYLLAGKVSRAELVAVSDAMPANLEKYKQLRTFERGVEGETLACGTGVTAAALIFSRIHHFGSPVAVQVQGQVGPQYQGLAGNAVAQPAQAPGLLVHGSWDARRLEVHEWGVSEFDWGHGKKPAPDFPEFFYTDTNPGVALGPSTTTTLPPAPLTARAPFAPSFPMPVSTTARQRRPQTAAADSRSASTEGRCRAVSGAASSQTWSPLLLRLSFMCRPAGAR